jgi:hypothetical protein
MHYQYAPHERCKNGSLIRVTGKVLNIELCSFELDTRLFIYKVDGSLLEKMIEAMQVIEVFGQVEEDVIKAHFIRNRFQVDLNINNTTTWTIMSENQKVLFSCLHYYLLACVNYLLVS